MQTEEEQQMQASEIAALPASDSLSASQVLGPQRGVKPFPGSVYHFTVNTNCVNGEIKWKQHIWNGNLRAGKGVEGIHYECYRPERALKAVRGISVVQLQYRTLKMMVNEASFNKTTQMFLCNLLNSTNQMELLTGQQMMAGQSSIQMSIAGDIIKEKCKRKTCDCSIYSYM